MTHWRVISADRQTTFCPVAIALRDEFTGDGVIGDARLSLDLQNGPHWTPTEVAPVRNPGGVYLYTGLGRAVDPVAAPQFRVRVRIQADNYRPLFGTTDDGIEFDVPTYNDTVPPAVSPLVPETVLLLPGPNYPFGGHVRVARGRVLDPGGTPLVDATVVADGVERAITGPGGAFSLPLRWQALNGAVNLQVDHLRRGLSAVVVLNLPGDLAGSNDITVT